MRSCHRMLLACVFGITPQIVAQNAVATQRSQNAVVSGVVLMNAYYNDDLVNGRDVPWLASPRHPIVGEPFTALGTTVRQSRILLSGWIPNVLGGTVDGELDFDLFGINPEADRQQPLPRLRRAVARIRWPHAWLIFGQEALPISPYDPSSWSTVGVPGFTGSGNLSRWMPQLRLGVDMGTGLRVGLEAAVVAPRFDIMMGGNTPQPDIAERSKRPFAQGRLLTRWGDESTGGEIGVGGHYGWFVMGADSLGVTRAATVTARLLVTSLVEVRGEAFLGEGLGMLGGGGVDQILAQDGTVVRTRGGWAQLNLHPTSSIEVGGGYGFDNPENDDLDMATGRSLNVSWEMHCHLRANPLLLALEYRRLETTYMDPFYDLQTANHLNMALGFEF